MNARKPRSRSAGLLAKVRRPPVLVGAGFLALTVGIVGNALFLQTVRHPAPLFGREAGVASPVAQPDALVQAIQSALQEAGYYGGPVDGIFGPRTEAAIGVFERNAGRAVTGRPHPDVLALIRASLREAAAETRSAAAAPPSGGAAGAALPRADARIAAVQDALAKAAYGPLQADGLLGRQTRDAIMRFQEDHGLPVTGEIDDALILELRTAGALEGE